MKFITLFKIAPGKLDEAKEYAKKLREFKEVREVYITLGRYDSVVICEAEDEKEALKLLAKSKEFGSSETLTAIPIEEARDLLK